MKMNRRNVIVGLGAIVTAGGGALATGAFSTVEADRDVEIGVAEDSAALLGLAAGASEFVTDDGGTLEIELTNVNLDATTRIDDAFTIANNSDDAGADQSIDVSVEITDYGDAVDGTVTEDQVDQIVQFRTDPSDSTTDILGTGTTLTLEDGTASEDIALVLDTTISAADSLDSEANLVDVITFTADGQLEDD